MAPHETPAPETTTVAEEEKAYAEALAQERAKPNRSGRKKVQKVARLAAATAKKQAKLLVLRYLIIGLLILLLIFVVTVFLIVIICKYLPFFSWFFQTIGVCPAF